VTAISSAMKKIIEDENLRHDLIKKGFEQVKKYSWGKMAEETLAVYNSIRI